MQAGIIITWDPDNGSGLARLLTREVVQIKYEAGRTFLLTSNNDVEVTASVDQPLGGHLKSPEVDDAVLIDMSSDARVWVYAAHYVDIAKRRHTQCQSS